MITKNREINLEAERKKNLDKIRKRRKDLMSTVSDDLKVIRKNKRKYELLFNLPESYVQKFTHIFEES